MHTCLKAVSKLRVHRYGDLEAVEDFLAVGKDANMRDPEGRTPLFIAVAYNHAPIVEELLRAGADVHAQARTRPTLPYHNPALTLPYAADVCRGVQQQQPCADRGGAGARRR